MPERILSLLLLLGMFCGIGAAVCLLGRKRAPRPPEPAAWQRIARKHKWRIR